MKFLAALQPQCLRPSSEGRVLLIRLHRPEALNALNGAMMSELTQLLDQAARDPEVGAVVLTGSPKAFAAGADIKEMAGQGPFELKAGGLLAHWDAVAAFPKPLIAAVQGHCLGGGLELAMACDLILAGEDAKFGQPEVKIGVIPGAGGTQRLTRLVGRQRAMWLVLGGEPIGAKQAEAWGLVAQVLPSELVVDHALALAQRFAALPPLALAEAKALIRGVDELPLGAGMQAERQAFFMLFASEDQKEGMAAFVEKRAPQWKGR